MLPNTVLVNEINDDEQNEQVTNTDQTLLHKKPPYPLPPAFK
jgi:hypothetical protein